MSQLSQTATKTEKNRLCCGESGGVSLLMTFLEYSERAKWVREPEKLGICHARLLSLHSRETRGAEREGPLKNSKKRSIDPVQLVKRAHMQRRATVSFRTEEDCAD